MVYVGSSPTFPNFKQTVGVKMSADNEIAVCCFTDCIIVAEVNHSSFWRVYIEEPDKEQLLLSILGGKKFAATEYEQACDYAEQMNDELCETEYGIAEYNFKFPIHNLLGYNDDRN